LGLQDDLVTGEVLELADEVALPPHRGLLADAALLAPSA
jgi:hypothetical protein